MASQASDSIRPKPRMTLADELAVVAQRAQSFTNASGAAIAIGEDDAAKDEIICRARSGPSAPDVGVALRVEGTFTGLCIQSGKEIRCDDAETDTRVDMAAVRSLGIRSMVVAPIREQGKVTGVLAVFAPLPNAFTITHVAVLKTMADQISGLLQKDRLVKDQPMAAPTAAATLSAPPPQAGAPVPPALPTPVTVAEPPKAARPAVPLPPPVVIKSPAASLNASPMSTASMSAAAAAPARATIASVPKVEAKPLSLADDISAPASVTAGSGTAGPGTKKEERREHKPEPTMPMAKPSFGTLDAVAAKPSSSSGKFIFIGLAVAVVVGGSAWFYLGIQKPRSQEPAQPQAQAQSAAPSTPVTGNAAAAPAAESIASAPPPQPAPVHSKSSAPEKTEDKRAAVRRPAQQEEPSPTPATVSVNRGQSKIAVRPADQSPDVSPSLAVGGGGSNGLSALARPVNTAVPGRVSQSDLVNATAVHTVPAAYPELAKSRGISGDVVIRVLVGKDGKPTRPVLVSGPVIFRDSAFDAVKQWVFKPARLNGQVVEQETEIHMKFHP
jgi:TonB family protein